MPSQNTFSLEGLLALWYAIVVFLMLLESPQKLSARSPPNFGSRVKSTERGSGPLNKLEV